MLLLVLAALAALLATQAYRRGRYTGILAGRAQCRSTHSRVFRSVYSEMRDSRNAWRSAFFHEHAEHNKTIAALEAYEQDASFNTDEHGYLLH